MSAQKAKGTRHESKIRDALAEFLGGRFGLAPRRVAQEGFADTGDLHGVSPFVIQAKDWRDIAGALREGVDGAVVQAARAEEDYGVAVIKRARRPIGDAYAVMRLEDWARLLLRLRRAEEHIEAMAPSVLRDHLADTARDRRQEFPK